jgi:hypothetical protein
MSKRNSVTKDKRQQIRVFRMGMRASLGRRKRNGTPESDC